MGRHAARVPNRLCRDRIVCGLFSAGRFPAGHGRRFAATGQLRLAWLLLPVPLCAIAGDQLGYFIGRKAGVNLYRREDSRFFKKKHLERAKAFYDKHGGKTIILARFIPVIRTFCPPVAGAARMRYSRYLTYDICGGILWVGSMVMIGFTLGK